MRITFVHFLIFFAGMLAQVFLMLSGRWQKGDFKKVWKAVAAGLIGFLPFEDSNERYFFSFHLLIACILAVASFTMVFRKRLISLISARTLLILNLILLYTIYAKTGFQPWLFGIAAVPSVITLLSGFSDFGSRFHWQIFFYIWYLVLIGVIGTINLMGILRLFYDNLGNQLITSAALFLLGGAFVYMVSNLWFLRYTTKVILSKPRMDLAPGNLVASGEYRRQLAVEDHKQLLAHGYIWHPHEIKLNMIIFVCVISFILLNYWSAALPSQIFITLLFLLLPIFDKSLDRFARQGDGVGKAPMAETA